MSDNQAGRPFFCIYKKGGAQIIAKKPESKNVTIIDSAERMPATTMTNAARTNMTREAAENPVIEDIRSYSVKIKIIFSSAAQRYRSGSTLWLTDRMDAVLAMCKASASYLHRKPDAVIYHGVKTDVYIPPESKEAAWKALNLLPKSANKGKHGIAILGRVREQKGVHLFVRSCIALLDKYPDYTAVIVGSISSSNERFVQELQAEIEKAGLAERIIFAGEQNFADIPKIFSALSLVVALSDNEGFGLTILEAMSSEAAVLASEAGAWPEVVRAGEDGYVVPVNDLAAVVDKMDLLLSDQEKLIQMGVNGRERVLEHYSVQREAKQLVDFYRSLM